MAVRCPSNVKGTMTGGEQVARNPGEEMKEGHTVTLSHHNVMSQLLKWGKFRLRLISRG